MSARLQILIVLVVAVFRCSIAGTCEPFAGSPSVCSAYINFNVFIPATTNQSAIAAANLASADLLKFVADLPCRSSLTRLLCANIFQRCASLLSGAVYPRPPCRGMCTNVTNSCAAYFSSIQQSARLPNCSSLDAASQPIYPIGPNVSVANGTDTVTCVASLDQISAGPAQNCTTPYAVASDGSCQIKCPYPVWSDDNQFHTNLVFYRIASPISLACFLVCLVLQLSGAGVTYPNDLHLNFVFVLMLTVLEALIAAAKNVACKDPVTPVRGSSSPFCGFIGFMLHYSFLAVPSWFACVSLNILMTLLRIESWANHIREIRIFFYLMSYGLPLLPTIITAALDKFVGGGQLGCVVDAGVWNGWAADGLFFAWLGTWVVFAVICLIAVFIRISLTVGLSALQKQSRLLVFCGIFGYIGLYTICFRIYTRVEQDTVIESVRNWAVCVSSGATDCRPGKRYSSTAFLVNSINQLILGPCALLLFGLTGPNLRRLARRFKEALKGNFNPDGISSYSPSTSKSKKPTGATVGTVGTDSDSTIGTISTDS